MFILNLGQKIAQRLEKHHIIWRESGEGFSADNDAVYAELKGQLGNHTPGNPTLPRQMPIDTHVGSLRGPEDSHNRSQERETLLDLGQTSIDWEQTLLDSDGWNHGSLDNPGGAVDSQMSNRLSLRLEDSQSGEAGPRASGLVFVTGRSRAGFHSPDHALTRGQEGYVLDKPSPAPIRGPPAHIPWTGPRPLPAIFNGDPSGVWVGRGPERGQGQGIAKKAPRPRPLSGAGRAKEAGGQHFSGRRPPRNEL